MRSKDNESDRQCYVLRRLQRLEPDAGLDAHGEWLDGRAETNMLKGDG